MSDMYAIKASTLTALGDAVRKNTGKYIGVEEKGEPFYIDEFIPTEMDFDKEVYGQSYFIKSINLKELLGDRYNSTGYLYFESEYTAESARVVRWLTLQKDENVRIGNFVSEDTPYTTENESGFISYSTPVDAPYIQVVMYSSNKNKTAKLKLKLWACDVNKKYIKLNTYTPLEMAEKINEFKTIPNSALNITGDCQYRFSFNASNWLIDLCGEEITTNNITNANYMFNSSSNLKEIPFEINLKNNCSIEYMFNSCSSLNVIPKVNLNITSHLKFGSVLHHCLNIREIPEWLIELLEADYNLSSKNSTFGPWTSLFKNCYSLRIIPDRVMRVMRNDNMTGNYYGVAYCKPFEGCRSLDELVNIHCDNYTYTSNQFSGFFSKLNRAKDITFTTNEDGSPVVRQWKSQTIDLTDLVGYSGAGTNDKNYILNYNSGITADKEVKDDATYAALKDDPDWFSADINYSRYNHDSAVRTIASLPDCSAYGTNIIKFKGAAGSKTDGGAINTLTEEEIAVASAKGWSVAFV